MDFFQQIHTDFIRADFKEKYPKLWKREDFKQYVEEAIQRHWQRTPEKAFSTHFVGNVFLGWTREMIKSRLIA